MYIISKKTIIFLVQFAINIHSKIFPRPQIANTRLWARFVKKNILVLIYSQLIALEIILNKQSIIRSAVYKMRFSSYSEWPFNLKTVRKMFSKKNRSRENQSGTHIFSFWYYKRKTDNSQFDTKQTNLWTIISRKWKRSISSVYCCNWW